MALGILAAIAVSDAPHFTPQELPRRAPWRNASPTVDATVNEIAHLEGAVTSSQGHRARGQRCARRDKKLHIS